MIAVVTGLLGNLLHVNLLHVDLLHVNSLHFNSLHVNPSTNILAPNLLP